MGVSSCGLGIRRAASVETRGCSRPQHAQSREQQLCKHAASTWSIQRVWIKDRSLEI